MPTAKRSARAQLAEYRKKRDFSRTREPRGGRGGRTATAAKGRLRFVVQKHAARHLHFDLRLELDGVMKSWAVPKGPSADPSVKRLAMQVEDHPIEYNIFEGTIPEGEYGGGTVMLWDSGTYTVDGADGDDEPAMRERYRKGDVKITFHGKRLRGSYALVRMRPRETGTKPSWLLIKHRDKHASTTDIVAKNMTSVESGRTMEEIAANASGKVWRSNRSNPGPARATPDLQPMFASIGKDVPRGDWVFEPKYDGIRVLAFCTKDEVGLITRNGLDKSRQFPEISEALRKVASGTRRALVLDGEIVALTRGAPARFQVLQGRMHVTDTSAIERHRESSPAAIVLFDILLDGDEALIHEPWTERRKRLERRIASRTSQVVRLTESFRGNGEKLVDRARAEGWEGVIAKEASSTYEPGVRSRSWLKLKIEYRQELVVGGYTEPRSSRQHLGAILLGYYDPKRNLVYAGHTGGGFSHATLADMYRRLKPLERPTSPFSTTPRTNERPHWVEPKVVVEVKFSEWTADGKLRQPIFLGIRTDKPASAIRREAESVQEEKKPAARPRKTRRPARRALRKARKSAGRLTARPRRTGAPSKFPSPGVVKKLLAPGEPTKILAQLDELCRTERRGTLDFGRGRKLSVTNLDKVFFKRERYTKGDLLRYYTLIAPLILPTIADRPLVLKRFPSGIGGEAFYQQKAQPDTPRDVRVETVVNDVGERQRRFIGGDLPTLLYTIQLGAISVDPWHSRVPHVDSADYAVIDLDPGPRAGFPRVAEVAGWVKETLDELGLHAGLKTSGATGLHVYIPLPPRTPTEAATLVAQVIATRVAEAHPREATIKRFVKHRGEATVYVDYLQNIKGKTLAGPYCARAKEGATVSTPLRWDELDDRFDPRGFTIVTAPERFAKVGDIWASVMKKRNVLDDLMK